MPAQLNIGSSGLGALGPILNIEAPPYNISRDKPVPRRYRPWPLLLIDIRSAVQLLRKQENYLERPTVYRSPHSGRRPTRPVVTLKPAPGTINPESIAEIPCNHGGPVEGVGMSLI